MTSSEDGLIMDPYKGELLERMDWVWMKWMGEATKNLLPERLYVLPSLIATGLHNWNFYCEAFKTSFSSIVPFTCFIFGYCSAWKKGVYQLLIPPKNKGSQQRNDIKRSDFRSKLGLWCKEHTQPMTETKQWIGKMSHPSFPPWYNTRSYAMRNQISKNTKHPWYQWWRPYTTNVYSNDCRKVYSIWAPQTPQKIVSYP